MKLLINRLLLIALLCVQTGFAQNVKVEQSRSMDYERLIYIGSNAKFNYFTSTKNAKDYLIKVNSEDITKITEEKILLKEPEIYKIFLSDSNLFYITFTGKPQHFINTSNGTELVKSTVTAVNLYKYDSYTNRLLAQKVISLKEEGISYSSSPYVDQDEQYIQLGGKKYDFNFETGDAFKKKENHPKEEAFQFTLNSHGANGKPNFEKWEREVKPYPVPKTIYSKTCIAEYKEKTDNSIAVFKITLSDIRIWNDNGKTFHTDIDLDEDKLPIDLHITSCPNKSLMVLGKYCQKKENEIIYGFFTINLDSNLDANKDIAYTPFIKTDENHTDLDKHLYAFLFFTSAYLSFTSQLTGNNSQFYFSQYFETKIKGVVNFEVVAGDLNILTIDTSGMVKVKNIPLNYNSRIFGYCRFTVISNEEKYYLIYYDDKANLATIDNKTRKVCDLSPKNTVMLAHEIDVNKLEIGAGTIVMDCKEYQAIPQTALIKPLRTENSRQMVYYYYTEGSIIKLTFNFK